MARLLFTQLQGVGFKALTLLSQEPGAVSEGDDRDPPRSLIASIYLIFSASISLIFQDYRAGWLALVVAVNFVAFVILWKAVFKRRLSYVDPGILFLGVVALYTIFPLLTVELLGFNLGDGQDTRLYKISLDDGIISSTILNANAIISGFGTAYLAFRKRNLPKLGLVTPNIYASLWVTFGVSVAVQFGLAWAGSGSENYGDEYLLVQSLPVYAIQILNIFLSLFYVSFFGLILILFREKNLKMVALLTVGSIIMFLLSTGARTPIVLVLFSVAIGWDHLYRRASFASITAFSILLVAGFLILGSLRAGNSSYASVFLQSEFMGVFVTALDIRQIYLTNSSLDMNFTLLVSDLFRLIPQQLLPFDKIDPASWYVTTFYPHYAASGGGFAFGMLAEAALGGEFIQTILRGAALGLVLSLSINFLAKRHAIWYYIIYLWVLALLYQSFRDTTFALIGKFTFQFLPAILLCVALAALLRKDSVQTTSHMGSRM